jgi:hypothetical protein
MRGFSVGMETIISDDRTTSDELERIWKKTDVTQLKYCPSICLKGRRKIMEYLRQDRSGWPVSRPIFEMHVPY